MEPADVAAILTDAKALLDTRPYQTRFIAALPTNKLESWSGGVRPKWIMCNPLTPDAMLSLHGAIIAAAGSGPVAWKVFDALRDWRIRFTTREPPTKAEALAILNDAISCASRRTMVRPRQAWAEELAV